MVLYKCTQINTRIPEVMLFCIASGNGVICYGIRKDLCTSEWRLLRCLKNAMAFYHHNRRYKGAKSIWDWSFSDWIAYFVILSILGIIYFFTKL